ncbi:transposase [Plakobranchus ocellatus]|uniref:Transposase n=1 Tax=Plakobranchus ocellatus TaxID=259542 RepID=A0AAV4BAM0_9GAST|nr:transposase [Plakobranchus ocellatus]
MLSDEHKRQGIEISQILLHRCQQEGDETVDVGPDGGHSARNKLLEHLITGDETWLHLSTPETKLDSMTWKHLSSPVTKNVWDNIPHPAHRQDPAPSDFHLFGPLNRHLGGKKFEYEDELIGEILDWFSKLDANIYTQGIYSLFPQW